MSNIVAFDSGNLPAYLKNKNADLASVNAEVVTAAAYPHISIKGKTWAVVRDGQRTVLQKQDEDGEMAPVQRIEVAVVRANMKSKVFYLKKFKEGDENMAPPDCYSLDGLAPSPNASNKQHTNCQICPHNQWGSRISDDGEAKGRACADQVRMAIATPDKLDDPYLLRVPPASIKLFKEAVKIAKSRNIPYNALVYRLGFDAEAASPKITFKPVGLLDDAGYAKVQEIYDDELVRAIAGLDEDARAAKPAAPAPAQGEVDADELDAALAKRAAAPAAAPAAPKASKPAPAPVESDDLDAALGGAPAPAPAPAPKAAAKPAVKKAAPVVQEADDLLGGLDALLGQSDD